MIQEAAQLDDEFEDVLFSSWVPTVKPFTSIYELQDALARKGQNLIHYQPVTFPEKLSLSRVCSVVKTSVDQMVMFGTDLQKGKEGVPGQIQHKAYFLNLDEPAVPQVRREWMHKSLVEIDNYIRHKDLEVLFGQDDFLHLYYKGQKSNLRLLGGKYFSNGGHQNKAKKVFRRGVKLFYQNKLNKGQGAVISLMKLDLDLLIEQLELSLKNPKHKTYDVSNCYIDLVATNFTDFVLDHEKILILYKRGSIVIFNADSKAKTEMILPSKSKYQNKTITIAVSGKYFVIYGTNSNDDSMHFRLVHYQKGPVSYCIVQDPDLCETLDETGGDGSEYYHWGHFRQYRNAAVGIFFRPLGRIQILAVMATRILHICEKGLGKPMVQGLTEDSEVNRKNNWIGIIPFSRQKKYYVFGSEYQVGVITLKM